MIAKIRQEAANSAAPARRPLLDRVILWSGILLIIAVAGFAAYYYIDRQGAEPSAQEGLQIDIAQYEQVVRDDPNNVANRLALADAYYGLERYSEAVSQYEAALVINGESALAHVGLGRARLAVGDLAGAAESLRVVIDQSKEEDISGTLVQTAHYYLGKIALQQQDPEAAIAELKEATAIERSDADAWYLMGTAYVRPYSSSRTSLKPTSSWRWCTTRRAKAAGRSTPGAWPPTRRASSTVPLKSSRPRSPNRRCCPRHTPDSVSCVSYRASATPQRWRTSRPCT
jgi:tetratricopeptide (TPR) repeat protein